MLMCFMNMWMSLEGTWPMRWMKDLLISLSLLLTSRREKEVDIEGDEKRNTIK